MHFNNYLSQVSKSSQELGLSVTQTSNEVIININTYFDYKSDVTGLLLGNVQSGKTAQMLGLIGKMADEGFDLFILLTTDNIYLQSQTLNRAAESLTTLRVCDENDDLNFIQTSLRKPTVLVLKKNTNVLRKWKNLIASSKLLEGRPIVIIDDEADAASLNTLVNKKLISRINNHLFNIKKLATSSIYIQVTATPQAVLLQSKISGWKPLFVNYFIPGNNYIGGDFIFSTPPSFCIKDTGENELEDFKRNTDVIPEGLKNSLLNFILISAEFKIKGKENCNFLVHPSVRIADHEIFAISLGENLNTFLECLNEGASKKEFFKTIKEIWVDLQKTQPDLSPFDDIKQTVDEMLNRMDFSIFVLNSKSPFEKNYNRGYNIIIGGNSLGRGITFSHLQIVYYCRKAKSPQADTFWQHSRIFGYDRIKGLIRVYLPPTLLELFTEINKANRLLINQIINNGLEGLQLIYPSNIKPTRKNVVDNSTLNMISGGINIFPLDPTEENGKVIDEMVYELKDGVYRVDGKLAINILSNVKDQISSSWDSKKFTACIKGLMLERPHQIFSLIIRRNRNISKGTRTLLSPNDRVLGDTFTNHTTLTIYRLNGNKESGWKGKPFWIPNIKFPEDVCFYDTIDF